MKSPPPALLPIPIRIDSQAMPSLPTRLKLKKANTAFIRIDPYKRTIARIRVKIGANAIGAVRRLVRAHNIGRYQISHLERDGQPINVVCFAREDVDATMRGWRAKGNIDTAGISILAGEIPGAGLVDCPVDVAWVQRMIVWLDHEDVDDAEA